MEGSPFQNSYATRLIPTTGESYAHQTSLNSYILKHHARSLTV